MILCIYGTTGEIIKLAPVLVRLYERGAPLTTWCTGQQPDELPEMIAGLGLPMPDVWLARGAAGRNLDRNSDIPRWAATVLRNFARQYRGIRQSITESTTPNLCIVHGDTLTTFVGALLGRALRLPVAHIEAGMRSHDLRNPFPEELVRRVVARIAMTHFAPGEVPVSNLRGERLVRGRIVDTVVNTVRDSLELVPDVVPQELAHLPDRFGVVSLHRFELLSDRPAFESVLGRLAKRAQETPLVFIDHAVTAAKIERYGLDHLFDDMHFMRVPKLGYFPFIALVRRSTFAVTDSGGLQQESSYLDHPCLVHRATTESPEGLGGNVVVSGLDLKILDDFLADPERFRHDTGAPQVHPADIVVEHLATAGYT